MPPDTTIYPEFRVGDTVRYPNDKHLYKVHATDGTSVWLKAIDPPNYRRGWVEQVSNLVLVPPAPPDIINYYVMFGGLSERYITSFGAEDRYLHTPTTGPKMLVKINLTQGTVDILRSKP